MEPTPLAGMTAIVIDDQEVIRTMVRGILRKLGAVNVQQAGGVDAGLQSIAEISPHFVLCDINMPGRNGLELVKAVRAGADSMIRRDLPVAMLTGHTDQAIVGTALALDASAFIVKPVSINQLGQRIERMLARPITLREAGHYAQISIPEFAGMTKAPEQPAPFSVLMSDMRSKDDQGPMMQIALSEVLPGDMLARDVRGSGGHLLLSSGHRLNASLVDRLSDLAGMDASLVKVWVRERG
jgi:two-component system chemotaxis response regulator CheY